MAVTDREKDVAETVTRLKKELKMRKPALRNRLRFNMSSNSFGPSEQFWQMACRVDAGRLFPVFVTPFTQP